MVSLNALITSCGRASEAQRAVDLLHTGLVPDLVSYNAAISACETTNQWQQALEGSSRKDFDALFDPSFEFTTVLMSIHSLYSLYSYHLNRPDSCVQGPGAPSGRFKRIKARCHELQCGHTS